jgi:peptide/nickel transport system substrate-binding protein
VLKRNPNYHGSRPRHFEQIVYSLGGSAQPDVRRVQSGEADYDVDLGELAPEALARLATRYGPGSAAARAGRQQLYIASTPGIRYLVLNTSRGLFADVNLRKAANYAIDRRALIRYHTNSGVPLDHYLPPGVPGYRAAHIYPLGRPDLVKARRLASGRGGHALMYVCSEIHCLNEGQVVKHDLKAIGIDVEIKQFPTGVLFEKLARPGEPWDILSGPAWVVDYADPLAFLVPLFDGSHIKEKGNNDFSLLDNPSLNRRLEAATRLTGPERYRVSEQLDLELARDQAPFIAYATWATHDFFSLRIGCHVLQPVYGTDLGALCVRKRK